MEPRVSVIISAHSPVLATLKRTLEGLRAQTLPRDQWELLLIDNASTPPLNAANLDFNWSATWRVVVEPQLGLTPARIRGFSEARSALFVLVDDDNVLAPDYLANVCRIFEERPRVGVIGGRSLPEFEHAPESWFADSNVSLGLRDLGPEVKVTDNGRTGETQSDGGGIYPTFAPIGAGMSIRREAALIWKKRVVEDSRRMLLGRRGQSLASGEDCDINLTSLRAGWDVGYFPELSLIHIIPARRLTREYLARMSFESSRTWVQVLSVHDVNPWPKISPWLVWPRKLRAYFRYRPWRGPLEQIRFQGACGIIEGRAGLP